MRKIKLFQITLFMIMMLCTGFMTCCTVYYTVDQFYLGDFRGVLLTSSSIVIFYLYAILFYRLTLLYAPIKDGVVLENSREETVCHLHTLFFIVLFYPVLKSCVVPIPLMRVYYILLGAKLGENTYSAGHILDPIFSEIGSNTLIGSGALIVAHALENNHLSYDTVKIGNGVTIGANAVIMSGVIIEDDAIVAIGAVVRKNTHIKAGEVWGGMPAKKISRKEILPIERSFAQLDKEAV